MDICGNTGQDGYLREHRQDGYLWEHRQDEYLWEHRQAGYLWEHRQDGYLWEHRQDGYLREHRQDGYLPGTQTRTPTTLTVLLWHVQAHLCSCPERSDRVVVCYLLNVPSNMRVYLRDGSAQTILRAATLRQKLQIRLFYLTQSQYTDTGPTSPSAEPITPGALAGQPLECQFVSHWYGSTPKKSRRQAGFEPGDLPLSRRTP